MLGAGCLALLMHFSLVVIYANPFHGRINRTGYLAGAYVYPYFHQSWSLFVPAPTCNYSLFAKADGDTFSTDVFNELVIKHQENRFYGYGPLVIAFSNSMHYFETNTRLRHTLNGPVKEDKFFAMIENAAEKYLQHSRKRKVTKVKLILVVEGVATKERRGYYN